LQQVRPSTRPFARNGRAMPTVAKYLPTVAAACFGNEHPGTVTFTCTRAQHPFGAGLGPRPGDRPAHRRGA
jgi:hypothetical protein